MFKGTTTESSAILAFPGQRFLQSAKSGIVPGAQRENSLRAAPIE